MVVLLPIGLFYGAKTYEQWRAFKTAEIFHTEAAELVHSGRYDEGIPKLQAALKAYPAYYAAWEELGVSYHMLGDHQKEMETYLEATKVLPESGSLFRELATAYHELGMHDKELEAAEIAVTLESSDPLFTRRVAERARKEASGEIVTEKLTRPHIHDHAGHEGAQVTPSATGTPAAETDHEGHNHENVLPTPAVETGHEGHDHADHEGHDH